MYSIPIWKGEKRWIKPLGIVIIVFCISIASYWFIQNKTLSLKGNHPRSVIPPSQTSNTASSSGSPKKNLTVKSLNKSLKSGEFIINETPRSSTNPQMQARGQVVIEGNYNKINQQISINKSYKQISSVPIPKTPPLGAQMESKDIVLSIEVYIGSNLNYQAQTLVHDNPNSDTNPFVLRLPYDSKNKSFNLKLYDQNKNALLSQDISI